MKKKILTLVLSATLLLTGCAPKTAHVVNDHERTAAEAMDYYCSSIHTSLVKHEPIKVEGARLYHCGPSGYLLVQDVDADNAMWYFVPSSASADEMYQDAVRESHTHI